MGSMHGRTQGAEHPSERLARAVHARVRTATETHHLLQRQPGRLGFVLHLLNIPAWSRAHVTDGPHMRSFECYARAHASVAARREKQRPCMAAPRTGSPAALGGSAVPC